MVKLSLIAAATENNVIGDGEKLLWSLPDDLKHFRATTRGHAVIMGRKTLDSIGRLLPDRTNIVLSRSGKVTIPGAVVVSNFDEALRKAREVEQEEIFVIGGGEIYKLALPLANIIYLTRVHTKIEGSATFPEISPEEWKEVRKEEHPKDEKHAFDMTFLKYERK